MDRGFAHRDQHVVISSDAKLCKLEPDTARGAGDDGKGSGCISHEFVLCWGCSARAIQRSCLTVDNRFEAARGAPRRRGSREFRARNRGRRFPTSQDVRGPGSPEGAPPAELPPPCLASQAGASSIHCLGTLKTVVTCSPTLSRPYPLGRRCDGVIRLSLIIARSYSCQHAAKYDDVYSGVLGYKPAGSDSSRSRKRASRDGWR